MNRQVKTVKTWSIVLLASILLICSCALAKYSGGTGDANAPYQIADVNDLMTLANDANDYNQCFILTADINLLGQSFTAAIIAPDTSTNNNFQGTDFTGKFDGSGHTIAHLTIYSDYNDYLGLFGLLNTGGEVKNLGLEDCNIMGYPGPDYAGGLAGFNRGSITNCYSTAFIRGYYRLGGLVGSNTAGSISNCYSTSIVGGSYKLGGLVGENDSEGSISYCHSNSTVGTINDSPTDVGGLAGSNSNGSIISQCYSQGSVRGYQVVGGLAGRSYFNGNISHCYSTADVNGTPGSYYIGGLVGTSEYGDWNGDSNNITDCYSTGPVSGTNYVGGLVGQDRFGSIAYCYSTSPVKGLNNSRNVGGLAGLIEHSSISNSYSNGVVNAINNPTYVGGLLGFNNYGSISNCYSNGLVVTLNNPPSTGGLIGSASGGSVSNSFWDTQTCGYTTSAGGTGKTSAEMKTSSTFTSADWDFVQTWDIEENLTYPFFRIYSDGDINHDGEVDFYDFAILASQWLQ